MGLWFRVPRLQQPQPMKGRLIGQQHQGSLIKSQNAGISSRLRSWGGFPVGAHESRDGGRSGMLPAAICSSSSGC